MSIQRLDIPDVILFQPKVFSDHRGHFFERFNNREFNECVGRQVEFVQDNQAYSTHGVLRGLHYQVVRPQGKLVSVTAGEVFDVAVDIRQDSPTFGRWVGAVLSDQNHCQLWIPEGFAHGYLVLSESAVFNYKVTDYWYPQYERCIRYNDTAIEIAWPDIGSPAILSEKDKMGHTLSTAVLA